VGAGLLGKWVWRGKQRGIPAYGLHRSIASSKQVLQVLLQRFSDFMVAQTGLDLLHVGWWDDIRFVLTKLA
jgi:hypothetical protein